MRVAHRVPCTHAEGPGRRFALWLSGCSLRCPGCCNPDLFDARAGSPTPVAGLVREIDTARAELDVEGITVLGGEPLEQLPALTSLCTQVAARGLSVLVFTGYTLGQARRRPGFARLWGSVDTLVDGRFDAKAPEPPPDAGGRRWLGSSNQCLHHRTSRYADPAVWRGQNHAELRVSPDGDVSVHGFPTHARRLVAALATK